MSQTQSNAQVRSQRVVTRRVLGFVAISALLPGAVQTYSGRPRVGRAALRVWGIFWALAALLLVGLLVFRGATVALLLNPIFLGLAGVILFVVALGWLALLVDSWRVAQPWKQSRGGQIASGVLVVVLSALMFFFSTVAASGLTALKDVSDIFTGGGTPVDDAGRLNVLLLGGDSGPTRQGMRPDSIMVASIDAETGRTVLISLPRNLEGAPIPASNPLHSLYPNGFDCPESACMLNGIYTLAEDNADLFNTDEDPGLVSMRDVVGNILGLTINQYAIVDLAGFESLIDAVGGIKLDIGHRVPIGGGTWPIVGYIEAGKNQQLDGYHALWYARSRAESSDYDRMARQKCVLSAMAKQLNPVTVATSFTDLAAAGKGMVKTSVGANEVSDLVDLALKAKDLPIASVSFAPPLIQVGVPDYAFIKAHTAEAIAASEALDSPSASASAKPTGSSAAPATKAATGTPAPANTPKPSASSSAAPKASSSNNQETDDLADVCSVSN